MTKEEYLECMDFSGIAAEMEEQEMKLSELSRLTGITQASLMSIIANKQIPFTDTVCKIACALHMDFNDVVFFVGIDTTFWGQYFTLPIEKEAIEVQPCYEPLRQRFNKYSYIDNDHKALFEFLDTVPSTERSLAQQAVTIKGMKNCSRMKDFDYHNINTMGLGSQIKHKILYDERLSLKIIYNICEKLHCPISDVLTYK